jgi:phytoene synthase
MRRIDDLVDNRKEGGEPLTADEIEKYASILDEWLQAVERGEEQPGFQQELLDTIRRFAIPLWPWKRLCTAMVYDLTHDRFETLFTFRRYAEGAAIAPASIFMHLCGVDRKPDRSFAAPSFRVQPEARDLALFSYFVHIIRDFEKDQRRNLNYFADNILQEYGLTVGQIHEIALTGRPTDEFRRLIGRYQAVADYYRLRARRRLDHLSPLLESQYALSLEIIYQLYLQIFERVNPDSGTFTTEALLPPPTEIRARLERTIGEFSASAR